MAAVAVLGSLMVLVAAALVPLAILARQMTVGGALGTLLITIPAAAIGVLVARRQPGNPIGWIVLGGALFDTLGSAAGAYAVLDYRLGYRWPAGPGSALLALYWAPLIVTFPLAILLFPDGRLPQLALGPLVLSSRCHQLAGGDLCRRRRRGSRARHPHPAQR